MRSREMIREISFECAIHLKGRTQDLILNRRISFECATAPCVLDENKVTACNQLLVSLKKFFRNILVITHVDAIKDVADNILEINKTGMDSYVTTD